MVSLKHINECGSVVQTQCSRQLLLVIWWKCSSVHVFTQFMGGREAPKGLKNAPIRSIQKSPFLPTLRRWVIVQVLVVVDIIIIVCAPPLISTLSLHFRPHIVWAPAPFKERSTMVRDTGSSHTVAVLCFCGSCPDSFGRHGSAEVDLPALPPPFLSPSDWLPHSPHLPYFGLSCLSTLVEQKYTQTRRKSEQRKKAWTHALTHVCVNAHTHVHTQTL